MKKEINQYFEGVEHTLNVLENNFWLSGQIIITKEEWKKIKDELLERE